MSTYSRDKITLGLIRAVLEIISIVGMYDIVPTYLRYLLSGRATMWQLEIMRKSVSVASGRAAMGQAAELGSAEAYAIIAEAYDIIAVKYQMEMGKTRRLLEVSAKKGFYVAHEYLGNIETEDGRVGNAIKHWAVAASAGSQYSLDKLMEAYRNSQFSKEGLGQVLRAFQSSNDEMKSKARCDYRRAKSEGRVNLSHGRTSSGLASFSSIKRRDKK